MEPFVLGLEEVDRTMIGLVGGKGANLGELARVDGVAVPGGFCVTTAAFRRFLAGVPSIHELLEELARLGPGDREELRELCATIRQRVEATGLPPELADAIDRRLSSAGRRGPYAVRSSATAEDLPTASFAGQQDTWLNVLGPAVLAHVVRCWASLYSERATTYRLQHGFDHREVRMAVVVQRLVVPEVAGTLFTADPVTSNRTVSALEACLGLGESLVSGTAAADHYRVRDGRIVERRIATKRTATRPTPGGGTEDRAVDPSLWDQPALTDAQVVQLERLGRRVEAHFGQPQDIEWCLADGAFQVVQSRPITTLYPVPDVGDGGRHVFVSVGHQQMMTDPMMPLGQYLFRLTAGRPMYAAGGRLFVDVSGELASPARRAGLLGLMGRSEPLIADALRTIVARDFIETAPDAPGAPVGGWGNPRGPAAGAPEEDDRALVADLIAGFERSLAALQTDIRSRSGTDLVDFILEDIQRLNRALADPRSFSAILGAMNAASWINDQMLAWLGEKNAADALAQSVPDNVTSEMGLALLDVADVVRPYPEVCDYLRRAEDEGFLEGLLPLAGGWEAHDALTAFLGRYGMRCAGEIDVTRPRWSERPTTLAPLILSNVRNFEPGAAPRSFERGQREAAAKEQDLLERLARLPDGEQKAAETQRAIRRLRDLAGYREFPKYHIISRYFVYRQALLREAERLVLRGVLQEREQIYALTLPDLREVIQTERLDAAMVRAREEEHARFRRLTPPRVMTSEGEIVAGAYRRSDLPEGALAGLAVSAGVVEGRARVLLDLSAADLAEGDILVTTFTDPSWTAAFVAIRGLVTEVGGLMTHGAVIAREYGLPAVVGVQDATRRIRDGQWIRVHGTDGYVEILGDTSRRPGSRYLDRHWIQVS